MDGVNLLDNVDVSARKKNRPTIAWVYRVAQKVNQYLIITNCINSIKASQWDQTFFRQIKVSVNIVGWY